VHHIFPKAQLYKIKHKRPEVNALANFCFLTKDTNLKILDQLPEKYFPEIEKKHPGALASQWIPADPALWKIENFGAFLEARRASLAAESNKRLNDLLHGELHWMEGTAVPATAPAPVVAVSGFSEETDDAELEALNAWMEDNGLPRGVLAFDFANGASGGQQALFDLAWPNGVQEELSGPVAILLHENSDTLMLASNAGFRCFTSIDAFKSYVTKDILATPE